MIVDRPPFFRLDVSRNTGTATLWMAMEESPYGFKPILTWARTEGIPEFAEMLLGIYRRAEPKKGIGSASWNMSRQMPNSWRLLQKRRNNE